MIYCAAELGGRKDRELVDGLVLSVVYGQEQVGASGIREKEDIYHILKI